MTLISQIIKTASQITQPFGCTSPMLCCVICDAVFILEGFEKDIRFQMIKIREKGGNQTETRWPLVINALKRWINL